MSIHPSLISADKDKKQRSVLKRIERLKKMIEKDEWKEGDDVFGLPKLKTLRIKIKKEKAPEEKPAAALAAEGAEGTTSATAEGEKEAQAAKKEEPAAKKSAAKGPKGQEKK